MRKFSESRRGHAKSIIDFEKKNLLQLTIQKLESHENTKLYCICGIRFFKKLLCSQMKSL